MDIGKSFTYMFDDKDWLKKIAIGGLLNIIPVVNFIPFGYAIRVLKRVSEQRPDPLPEWDDWGGDFVKGLMGYFLAPLIYSIPIFILQIISWIVAAVAGSGNTSDAAGICVAAAGCLSSLWGLVIGVVLPAGIIKYAHSGEFGSFFRFGELFRFIGDNLGNYIIAILLGLVAFIAAGIVGGIACGVGVFFTIFWATLVLAYLLAEVAPAAVPPAAVDTSYGELSTTDLGEISAPPSES
jgi:hypothetical protein